ncbi:plasmid pRiA4b ORF-3 family protein [Capillimicrobium parvum]|uniref:plasmid pRiA4b ORF-3 family protein n=1 Tax=Capillimicrobium parvum TaxID=2884022 RepID=UPI00216AEA41|nr:plasmid pRiA4b ORF-3 family protein [Capillimicrobium parvum]
MSSADEVVAPEVLAATAPARWLLDQAEAGVPLTQTYALARVVVREAAERWPGWWDAELFGPPHREAELAVLEALHEGLRRLRLVRRGGRRLLTTARGRELAADPGALLQALAADLGAGDAFTESVAVAVLDALRGGESCDWRELDAAAFARVRRQPWAGPDGAPPGERDVGAVVGDVLRRGEAYGLVERFPDPAQPRLRGHRLALSPAGRMVFGGGTATAGPVYVFDATLANVRGVRARIAVRGDQHLTALHDAIQEAFGWLDDHLYSFWLDGRFWGDDDTEYTSPVTPDEASHTAEVPVSELDLSVGAKIAYVFDFGDEWRVRLSLRAIEEADGARYPRVVTRTGQAPPQYPDVGLDD